MDVQLAQWLGRRTTDVSELIVVIGKSEPGDRITPEQKEHIWRMYLADSKYAPVTIHKDEANSPLTSIYKLNEGHPGDPFSIAIPDNIAKNETFQTHFEVFPNYQIIITPSYDREVNTKINEALNNGDFREFSKYIPPTLPLDRKQEIFDYLKPAPKQDEGVLGEDFWRTTMNGLYEKYGLKLVK
jgi:hypothetical protein